MSFTDPQNPKMQACEALSYYYLSYVNDFLSVGRFAEYHGLHIDEAATLIKLGRKIANRPHPDA